MVRSDVIKKPRCLTGAKNQSKILNSYVLSCAPSFSLLVVREILRGQVELCVVRHAIRLSSKQITLQPPHLIGFRIQPYVSGAPKLTNDAHQHYNAEGHR